FFRLLIQSFAGPQVCVVCACLREAFSSCPSWVGSGQVRAPASDREGAKQGHLLGSEPPKRDPSSALFNRLRVPESQHHPRTRRPPGASSQSRASQGG